MHNSTTLVYHFYSKLLLKSFDSKEEVVNQLQGYTFDNRRPHSLDNVVIVCRKFFGKEHELWAKPLKNCHEEVSRILSFQFEQSRYDDSFIRRNRELVAVLNELSQDFLKSFLWTKLRETKAIGNIDEYVDNLNIDALLDTYSIRIEDRYRIKPGGDDSASAWLVTDGLPPLLDYDPYLQMIFPFYFSGRIYFDFGFQSASSMTANSDDLELWPQIVSRFNSFIPRFQDLYKKEEHKFYLKKMGSNVYGRYDKLFESYNLELKKVYRDIIINEFLE